MSNAIPGREGPQFDQCRYGGSRLLFRGPQRTLEGEFIACLGGTETFARDVSAPFPDIVEHLTGVTCVNFGWPNAGVDVFANDRALMGCAARAKACVLQVPGAANMSNMYYSVHPRRNDRFLQPTEALKALFPEVDFMEFSFTRHLLGHLMAQSPERFAYIRKELATVWVNAMRNLIEEIGVPVVLLWLSAREPEADGGGPDPAPLPDRGQGPALNHEPTLVTRSMLDAVHPLAAGLVEIVVPEAGQPVAGRVGRARLLGFGEAAHARAAEALVPALAALLDD